jgi:hypothetical protein
MAPRRKRHRHSAKDTALAKPTRWRLQHGDFSEPMRIPDPETGTPVTVRRAPGARPAPSDPDTPLEAPWKPAGWPPASGHLPPPAANARPRPAALVGPTTRMSPRPPEARGDPPPNMPLEGPRKPAGWPLAPGLYPPPCGESQTPLHGDPRANGAVPPGPVGLCGGRARAVSLATEQKTRLPAQVAKTFKGLCDVRGNLEVARLPRLPAAPPPPSPPRRCACRNPPGLPAPSRRVRSPPCCPTPRTRARTRPSRSPRSQPRSSSSASTCRCSETNSAGL